MKLYLLTTIITLLTINSFATEIKSETNNTVENNTVENNTVESNSSENNLTTILDIEVNTDNCIGCHGLNFEKTAMGMSNIVSEMTKEYIEATLFNYKYNSVEGNMNPLMSWQTAKLTDDEIKAIAKKFGK